MALNVGASVAGRHDSYKKFSLTRFAHKHLFVIENKIEGGELPSLFVSGGSFPFNHIETFPIERDNRNINYPSNVDVREMDLEFYESMDNAVWDYFEAWNSLVFHNDTTLFNVPNKFKRSIYLFRLDALSPNGSSEYPRVFGYEYAGCFPKHISDYPLDGTSSGVVSLTINFSVDQVIRLKSGQGIVQPQILDRSSVMMDSSPLQNTEQAPPPPQPQQHNPIEGKVIENASREAELVRAEAMWRDLQTEMEIREAKTKGAQMARWSTERIAIWVAMLLKAAARTGINILEREAYYMAYAAMNSDRQKKLFGQIAGGVRKAGDAVR